MIRWTGLAAWDFEFLFPGSLTSTLLGFVPTLITLYLFGEGLGLQVSVRGAGAHLPDADHLEPRRPLNNPTP